MKRVDRRRKGAPRQTQWTVTAWWPRQAGFSMTVTAEDKDHARRQVEDAARSLGWEVGRPRKISIVRVTK